MVCPILFQGDYAMTAINPTIKLFTSKEGNNAGIQINCLILEHNNDNYHLHGGTRDTIHVFIESIALYVLVINRSNGTIGLNAYMTPEPDPINSMYLHNNKEISEYLGNKWEGMTPVSIVKQLINYLY